MAPLVIDAANWPALSSLLDQGLDVPAAGRMAWLASLPHDHQALKPELERLLGSPSCRTSEPIAAARHEHQRGEIVGRWKLLERIGEGGMASVWTAERLDGMLGRPAALKLPAQGWYGPSLAARLEREREILGTLSHPNIASLLDAGITADRQPYLVLEYVDGVPIDRYCREQALSVRAILELFLQVARAISYAHRALVIHRDIKPDNILVTSNGTARVLDFGIAKLLDGGEAQVTLLTEVSGRALTPEYASPEQIRSEPLTVTSDVYALGVLLYTLISGSSPYKARRESRAALEEAILEADPAPPSRKIPDGRARRIVQGDLDTVILKALKKSAAERYATVDAFAEDVQRFLETRPVAAQPDRLWYRVSKFVRRHHAGVSAAAAVAAALGAGAVLALWQAQIALAEKQSAEAAKTFLVSTMLDAHSYRGTGKPVSALDLLRQSRGRLQQLEHADPETRVELMNILGASLMSLQDTAAAATLFERAVRESASLERSHPQRLRAQLLSIWAAIFRGNAIESEPAIDRLLADLNEAGGALPEDFAGALRTKAVAAAAAGNGAVAVAFSMRALRAAEPTLGAHHNQSVLALVELCHAYRVSGDQAPAIATGRRALARALEAYGGRQTHPNVMRARSALARAFGSSGQTDLAVRELEQVVRDGVSLFGPSGRSVGEDLLAMAALESSAGRFREALEHVDRALPILEVQFDRHSSGYAAALELQRKILQHHRTR